MRILCIAPHVPWPLHGGPSLRIYHTIRVLADRGHEISLLAGHPSDGELPDLFRLSEITDEIVTFETRTGGRFRRLLTSLVSPAPYPARTFATSDYRQTLADHLPGTWDLILVNHLILVEALREVGPPSAPVVLDQHESQTKVWEEYAAEGSFPERIFALQNLPKVRRARRRAWSILDAVVCVAEEEVAELEDNAPEDIPFLLAPNGVDPAELDPSEAPPLPEREPNMVFCAGMSVERNVQAALWFADEVLPDVRTSVPEARFLVVGANPPESVQALDDRDGVEVTGTVPDVRPYYERSRVAVIPNRFGGFSKLKLSEAMAMGLPIVATESGAKGAPAGQDLVRIAEDAEAFAQAVVELLSEDKRATDIGRRARETAEQELSWRTIIGSLERDLRRISAETQEKRSSGGRD